MNSLSKNLARALLTTAVAAMSSGAAGPADATATRASRVLPLRSVDLATSSDELRDVAGIVDGARIVGFGEGWHYVHEFLSVRNRLFAYLVEHAGVTAYAGETGFERGIVADAFVTGRSELSSDAIGAVFYNAELAENRQLLEWIRAYNARPSTRRPVRFYGIDIGGGRSRPPRPAAALDYIALRDPALARQFEQRLQAMRSPLTAENYGALPAHERSALAEAIADLVDTFEGMRFEWTRASSVAEFELAYRAALVSRQANAQLRCDERLRTKQIEQSVSCEQLRDAAMAENVRWVLEREGPQGRVFVFAHNWHVDKVGGKAAALGSGTVRSTGSYLHETLGARYRVVGSMTGGMAVRDFPGFDAMFFIDKVQPCHGCDPKLATP